MIVHIMCARVLGPLSYGAFGSLVSATAAGEVWRFSTQVRTTSEVAGGMQPIASITYVRKRLIQSAPLLVLAFALVATFASVGGYIAALTGVVFILSSVWSAGRRGVALGSGMVTSAALGLVVCATSRVVFSLLGALVWGVPGAMAGGAAAELLGGAMVRLPSDSRAAQITPQVRSNWLSMVGLSLSPPGGDVLLMGPHMSPADASSYAAASAFSRGALVVGQLLLMSYLPILTRDGRGAFMKKGKHAVFIVGALAAVGCAGAPILLSLLADKSMVSMLAFGAGFVSAIGASYVNMVSYSMVNFPETRSRAVLVSWSGVLLVMLASLSIRPGGVNQASLVLVVSSVFSAFIAYVCHRRAS